MAAGRSVANHGNIKADHFVWCYHELIIMIILLKGSYQRQQRKQKGPNCIFVFCHPPFLILSRPFSTWAQHGPKFLHVNPT